MFVISYRTFGRISISQKMKCDLFTTPPVYFPIQDFPVGHRFYCSVLEYLYDQNDVVIKVHSFKKKKKAL